MKILGVEMHQIFCISKQVCGLPIYGGVIPKQPAFTRQILKDVSYKYESVFFIRWPPVNFHINRGDFLLKIRGGPWTWSMDQVHGVVHGPCPWGDPWLFNIVLNDTSLTSTLSTHHYQFYNNISGSVWLWFKLYLLSFYQPPRPNMKLNIAK